MWQIFAFSSLVLDQSRRVVDKIIIAGDKSIDTVLATFWRNVIYFIIAVLVGTSGIVGRLELFIRWPIVIFALLSIGSAIFFTYLLKKVELTGAAALSYVAPFLFLLIDLFVLKSPISTAQIAGVLILICGGLIFIINPLTYRIKPEYTKYVWGIFLFQLIVGGTDYYTFKHYTVTQNLNGISFIASTWLLVVIGFIPLILLLGKGKNLLSTMRQNNYLAKVSLSKGIEIFGTVLWYQAIRMASVSQVEALSVFAPLILLVIVYVTQQELNFKADEDFSKTGYRQKVLATALLILGAWLAS